MITGNPNDDGFAQLLQASHANPAAIPKIGKAALPARKKMKEIPIGQPDETQNP